jgi:hypothetical protein
MRAFGADLVGRKKMKRLVICMIVSVMAAAAHATECSVPASPGTVTIMSAGSTGSNQIVTASLHPQRAGGVVNLIGFEVTGGGIQSGTLTINGLVGGTLTYILPNQVPFVIHFPCPLTGIVNTTVTANVNPFGLLPNAYALDIHGF